ncbi:MAG: formylmethanofuran dehydrogenase subunit C, partial [Candidatus Hydrothermarchaeaceae archaeon]
MDIVLKPKKQPREGLDADVINPDIFAGRSIAEIDALEIFNGNRRVKLAEFFDVSGSTSSSSEDIRIIIDGDVSRTKRIGQGMKAGEILIKGSIDMYVGAEMKGGRIIVE